MSKKRGGGGAEPDIPAEILCLSLKDLVTRGPDGRGPSSSPLGRPRSLCGDCVSAGREVPKSAVIGLDLRALSAPDLPLPTAAEHTAQGRVPGSQPGGPGRGRRDPWHR